MNINTCFLKEKILFTLGFFLFFWQGNLNKTHGGAWIIIALLIKKKQKTKNTHLFIFRPLDIPLAYIQLLALVFRNCQVTFSDADRKFLFANFQEKN